MNLRILDQHFQFGCWLDASKERRTDEPNPSSILNAVKRTVR
jgi:hypothetical protein